ncbi:MAG: mechanosensitive ion channel domain-containing protein, partial [Pseudomonadota bacterium]
AAGLDLSNLAIIAGALSVGIGFGLQNIVNNFVSGVILLVERPIKIGDWIEVAGASGYVKKINVRSTEIETFERASVIVPNSELIAAAVTNWTHTSLSGRATVPVGVGYDSDVDEVARILREAAAAHPMVQRYPQPWANFASFGDSALEFELRCYVRDVNSRLSVESDLRGEILKRLRAAGVDIPFPQRVVTVAGGGGAAALEG